MDKKKRNNTPVILWKDICSTIVSVRPLNLWDEIPHPSYFIISCGDIGRLVGTSNVYVLSVLYLNCFVACVFFTAVSLQ